MKLQENMKGLGYSSSGSASDYGLKGPGFESRCRWELGSSAPSLSFLSYLSDLSISGASLIRSFMEVQHYWFSIFQENEKLSSAAWGEASITCTERAIKRSNEKNIFCRTLWKRMKNEKTKKGGQIGAVKIINLWQKDFFATEKSKKMFVCLILTFQLSLSFQSWKIEVSV